MVVRMTDDSLRVVSVDGKIPVGDVEYDLAGFSFITQPGSTPDPPDFVPLYWDNFTQEIPSEYSSIEGRLEFVDYDWSEEDGEATWSCDFICNDVKLNSSRHTIYTGDDGISLDIIST